jgi:hypothetical protein
MVFLRKHGLWLIMGLTVLLAGLRSAKTFDHAISWDVKGYYLYLPAMFIYHDPLISDVTWVEQVQETYTTAATLYMLNETEQGNHVIKYTMGLSWLYSPMFFTGHLFALLHPAWPADGFSLPYRLALSLGFFVYVFLGMLFLRKILLRYFDHTTVFVTILLMVSGTNLLNQFAFHTLLSHTPLFFLVALLIWSSIRFYDVVGGHEGAFDSSAAGNGSRSFPVLPSGAAFGWFMVVALTCGLITLIRPTEAVCLLLFLFWGAGSWKLIVDRMAFFLTRPVWILLFVLVVFMVIMPQLVYWKTLTGNWLHYSYDNPGEGLDLLAPHTLDFLFSFRKGWLVYTPLMWLALAGLVSLFRQRKELFLPIVLYLVFSIYLMSSWTTWWYAGGCFSSRTMISTYPALAIPMGYAVGRILRWKSWKKRSALLLLLFFVFLNGFQTWQFQHGIITLETMTRAYYVRSFLKTSVTDQDKRLLLVQRPLATRETFPGGSHYGSHLAVKEGFSQDDYPGFRFESHGMDAHRALMVLDSLTSFSPVFEKTFGELTNSDHAWLRGRAVLYLPEGYAGPDPLLVMTFTHNGENYKYRSSETNPGTLTPGQRNVISLDYLTPEVRRQTDLLRVYVWHRGMQGVYLDSLSLEVFTPLPE